MNFVPKKKKFTKQFKGKINNQIHKNIKSNTVFNGSIGLKAVKYGILNSKHFEAIKQSVNKSLKKTGRILFFYTPQIPKTKKPLAMRMGKGKGQVNHWICKIQPGMVLCEVNTSNLALAAKALAAAKFRLPIKTKLTFEK